MVFNTSAKHAAKPCRADSLDDPKPLTSLFNVYSVSKERVELFSTALMCSIRKIIRH